MFVRHGWFSFHEVQIMTLDRIGQFIYQRGNLSKPDFVRKHISFHDTRFPVKCDSSRIVFG